MKKEKTAEVSKEVFTPEVLKMHEKAEGKIAKTIKQVEKGYLSIVTEVALINHHATYKVDGYKGLANYLDDKFGMKKSTMYNLLAIAERYCDQENFKLLEEYQNVSMNNLLLATCVSRQDEDKLPSDWKTMPYRELQAELIKMGLIEDKGKKKIEKDTEETNCEEEPVESDGNAETVEKVCDMKGNISFAEGIEKEELIEALVSYVQMFLIDNLTTTATTPATTFDISICGHYEK